MIIRKCKKSEEVQLSKESNDDEEDLQSTIELKMEIAENDGKCLLELPKGDDEKELEALLKFFDSMGVLGLHLLRHHVR